MARRARVAKIVRKTKETDITLELNLDGSGSHKVSTAVPFFDHMLDLLAKHALFDLKIKAKGDIVLGSANIWSATMNKSGDVWSLSFSHGGMSLHGSA